MTMNVLIATRDFAICASDQRLTRPSGQIVTERSMKLTAFKCRDMIGGFITYNGIGRDQSGKTPSDWLLEIDNLAELSLDGIATRLGQLAEQKIATLPSDYQDRRHSFLGVGFLLGQPTPRPFLFCVSNYENLENDDHTLIPTTEFSIDVRADNGNKSKENAIYIAGDTRFLKNKRLTEYFDVLKTPITAMKAKTIAVKLIKSASFAGDRRGAVGSRVSWGIVHSNGHQETGGSAIGGSGVLELPNVILPGLMVSDIYIQATPPANGSRHDRVNRRFVIREPRCRLCSNPVPEGDKLCGVCGSRIDP